MNRKSKKVLSGGQKGCLKVSTNRNRFDKVSEKELNVHYASKQRFVNNKGLKQKGNKDERVTMIRLIKNRRSGLVPY